MLFVSSGSVEYSLEDKFLFNKDTGLYLACHQVTGELREMPLSEHDGDFWWYVSEDGQAKSCFSDGSVSLAQVSDGASHEIIEQDNVPVRRMDALIEEALNARAADSAPEPEVPEPEPVVEAPVPVSEPEPVVEAPVPVSEPEPVVEAPAPVSEPEPVVEAPAPVSEPEADKQ